MRKMGGLRTKIPWTFWTMTMGTFAIAGIPPLAGFYSKDAILYNALVSPYGSWIYWAIGLFTAFLTSFYMFRQWFMTFFGDYRGEADSHGAHSHDAHGGHGHGGVHESPMVMVIPLVLLAILSVVGGFIGSSNDRFEKFLSPVFHPTMTVSAETGTQAIPAPVEEPKQEGNAPSEGLMAAVSVVVALLGLALAWYLYIARPELPQQIATALGSFYQAVLHKYYVDEIYAALFVKPLIDGSTKILWHGVDEGVIDATLNNSASSALEVSDAARHMQSGNIRSYAGWITAGAAAVIVFMVWMGTR
jgi:NADH-quinone oxidoreductase subunit L